MIKNVNDIFENKVIFRGLKNASYLTISNFISLILNFFGFVYIARFLGPEEYGIYVSVGAFVGLFSILTFGGLNKVILREGSKDLNQMKEYFEETTAIKLLFTLFSIIICIFSSLFLPYSFQEKIFIIIFSFSLINTSYKGFFGIVFQAAEKMQYNAFLSILDRIIFISFAIPLLYIGFGVFTLIIILLGTQFFVLSINYILTRKFIKFKFFKKILINPKIIKSALIFSVLSFGVFLTTDIDLVMISWLGSSKEVGIYGVSHKIVRSVIAIRNILATAFFPIFVKLFYNKKVKWKRLVSYSTILGLSLFFVAIVGSLISEFGIVSLFGNNYSQSGIILSVLIFYISVSFATIPFTNTLQATHNELTSLKIFLIPPICNIILNYILYEILGLIGIAYSTILVGIINIPLLVFFTWRILKKQDKIY